MSAVNLLAMEGWLIGVIAGAIALVVIILVICYITIKNRLIETVNRTEESWSTIDVYLKKRYDLIPNLVEVVKGYAKHEEETLTRVISARNAIGGSMSEEDRIKAENLLGSELKTFMNMTVERYPELKANLQFMDLANQLKTIEGELVNARKYYNGNVRAYNNAIMKFPGSLVANGMRLRKKPYFELDSEEERRVPNVQF